MRQLVLYCKTKSPCQHNCLLRVVYMAVILAFIASCCVCIISKTRANSAKVKSFLESAHLIYYKIVERSIQKEKNIFLLSCVIKSFLFIFLLPHCHMLFSPRGFQLIQFLKFFTLLLQRSKSSHSKVFYRIFKIINKPICLLHCICKCT